MRGNLIIDGNAVYEIDMDCMEQLEKRREKEKLSNEIKFSHFKKEKDSKEQKQ